MGLDVTYKGQQIAQLTEDGNLTLETAGRYCEGDIELAYTGGGGGDINPVAADNDVIFIDYDGTIRYSYSIAEFEALTELPPNPTHDGMTAQGWNWTLADAKAYVAQYDELIIGQTYASSDGKIKIYVHVVYARPTLTVNFGLNGNAVIDWGDGSSTQLTGTNANTNIASEHTYALNGDYIISVAYTGTLNTISQKKLATFASKIIFPNNSIAIRRESLKINVQNIVLPKNSYVDIAMWLFQNNTALEAIVLSGTLPGRNAFDGCTALGAISLSNNFSTLDAYLFAYTMTKKITLSPNLNTIGDNCFRNSSLTRIKIPKNVTTILSGAFRWSAQLSLIVFYPTTPPTLSDSSVFNSIGPNPVFVIPYESTAYFTATNYPSTSSNLYLGLYRGTVGETLPATAGDGAYSLSWYATIDDAKAETNPITTMQGREVYCRYAAL